MISHLGVSSWPTWDKKVVAATKGKSRDGGGWWSEQSRKVFLATRRSSHLSQSAEVLQRFHVPRDRQTRTTDNWQPTRRNEESVKCVGGWSEGRLASDAWLKEFRKVISVNA